MLRDNLLNKHMGMIDFSYSMVGNEIGLKSSIIDVGNWLISGVNSQGNRKVDPMLMV